MTEAIQDQAAFHMILSISAHHMCSVRGQEPSHEALWHKAKGMRLLNERLSDPVMGTSNDSIEVRLQRLLSHPNAQTF